MDLVHSQTDSGLLVLAQGADEVAVARALREHDDDLRLVPQDSDSFGRRVYKVYRFCGYERPAEFLFLWGDDYGNAWPLSMQIVEKARLHDKNMRGNAEYVDPDEHNRRMKERIQRGYDSDVDTIKSEELRRGTKSYVFHRSPALAVARRRGRRKGTTY